MKIRVLSDLHLEFTKYVKGPFPSVGEDLVILAGDIGIGVKGIEWAREAFPGRDVVYILGNHEFYEYDWNNLIVQAREAAAGSRVHFLENDKLDLGGVRILGCSLWTDFAVMGRMLTPDCRTVAQAEMADYKLIRKDHRRRKLLTADTIERCRQSYHWLDCEIREADRKLLVVTHHAPTMATTAPWNAILLSNAAFHNGYDDLIRPPVALWIHGHTHHSAAATVNGIPVVSNQRGYPGEGVLFSWDYCVEV
jgi:predicted phosphodiesterase